MISKIEGFILTGGKSRRMGRDKALLQFEGKIFLERALNALSAVCENRVKIVLNLKQSAKFENILPEIIKVFDIFPERGAPGGIHAALANSTSEWTLILACDLPLVTGETIKYLANTVSTAQPDIAAVVPKQADGNFQPLCAIYKTAVCLTKLEELLISQSSPSVRDFLNLISTQYVEDFAHQRSVFFNVNTPEDFQLL